MPRRQAPLLPADLMVELRNLRKLRANDQKTKAKLRVALKESQSLADNRQQKIVALEKK